MNSRQFPSCSLLISTYNWPEALAKSIKSVFEQSILPNEILIADDGSDERTAGVIQSLTKASPVPIVHIWHADEGFRLSEIRNKAIAKAQYEYLIQIDGDIILERHFIQDHLEMASPDVFLCGSRVLMEAPLSERLLGQDQLVIPKSSLPLGYLLNSFRIPLLGKIMASRYKKDDLTRLRGCNMSFWKKDLIAVNGYNNDITGWGSEDAELAIRLINLGCQKRFLKFMGIAFHIYHQEKSKAQLKKNQEMLEKAICEKITWIKNGIKNKPE